MFPTIKHLSDLLPYVRDNPQFRVQPQPNGTTVVCYMTQDDDTFAGEHEAWYKECRGITFHADGLIAARTLHKFKNIGESDQTQPDQIPWDRIARIMPKVDGSMINFVKIDGQIVGKTKKTFTSNEACAATKFLHADPARVFWVTDSLRQGLTPTFEWTSPQFPIVLTYAQDELTLLHVRTNDTGQYLHLDDSFRQYCPFPLVENLLDQFEHPRELLELARTVEDIEGWVIQADDGEMWKIKTAWYVQLHRAISFTRWRDVARTVVEDGSDDLKAAFTMTGRPIEPILKVERRIRESIRLAQMEVERVSQDAVDRKLTAKELALQEAEHEYFGLIMSAFRGKSIDWFEWYRKNHLLTWSLEVIPTAVQNEDAEA